MLSENKVLIFKNQITKDSKKNYIFMIREDEIFETLVIKFCEF